MEEKTELTKLSEVEVEHWQDGLLECSFDRQHHRREGFDPPTKEVIGTLNERFIVSKTEILTGISLVRQFASVANIPTNWNVPPALAPAFDREKALYALMLSLDFSMKNLVPFKNNKFAGHEDELMELDDKLTKLMKFADIVRGMMQHLRLKLGDPDIELKYAAPPIEKPYVEPSKPRGVIRQPSQPAKPKFNLSSLMGKKDQ